MLPNSISRWRTFAGHQPPYQFTLFSNTIFALSGMLNAILFFSTRPDLVKGPSITIESTHDIPLHHRKDSTGYTSSHSFGHLPEHSYTSDLPLSGANKFTPASEFDPMALAPEHQEHYISSPSSHSGSLKPPQHARNPSYYVEYGRSKESSSMLEEDEDYGRLPG